MNSKEILMVVEAVSNEKSVDEEIIFVHGVILVGSNAGDEE